MEYYDLKADSTFLISQKAIILYNNNFLILGRKVKDTFIWELPGGLLEMNETMLNGLVREVKEETGLDIETSELFDTWDHYLDNFIFKDGRKLKCRFIELAFKCKCSNDQVIISNEHDTYKWVNVESLDKLSFSVNSKHAIEKFIKLGI
jgi:8-oxo-dGTP pyrophosphatase MutT (NUDIX family)